MFEHSPPCSALRLISPKESGPRSIFRSLKPGFGTSSIAAPPSFTRSESMGIVSFRNETIPIDSERVNEGGAAIDDVPKPGLRLLKMLLGPLSFGDIKRSAEHGGLSSKLYWAGREIKPTFFTAFCEQLDLVTRGHCLPAQPRAASLLNHVSVI